MSRWLTELVTYLSSQSVANSVGQVVLQTWICIYVIGIQGDNLYIMQILYFFYWKSCTEWTRLSQYTAHSRAQRKRNREMVRCTSFTHLSDTSIHHMWKQKHPSPSAMITFILFLEIYLLLFHGNFTDWCSYSVFSH